MKFECLNFFVVFGKKHFDHLVTSYLEFYNEVRPHQSLGNRPLTGNWHEVDEPLIEGEQIICHEKLGGYYGITNAWLRKRFFFERSWTIIF